MTSIQLCAEESVLQFANRQALVDLGTFIQGPTLYNASRLLSIPAIYNVLKEETRGEPYPEPLLNVCMWIYDRGKDILNSLWVNDMLPDNTVEASARDDWETVGLVKYVMEHLIRYMVAVRMLLFHAEDPPPSYLSTSEI
jgi:hypothetical protein